VPSRKKPAFESIDWDKVDMADLDSDLEDEDENENKPVDMMQKYLDSLNPGLKLTYLLFPLCCFMHQCCVCVACVRVCVRLELIFTALFLAEVKERERQKEEEKLMKKQKREKHKAKGPWDDWIALNWMDWFTLGIIILQVRFFFLMRTFELSSFSPSSFRFWCVPSPRSKSRFRSRPYTTSSTTQRSSPA